MSDLNRHGNNAHPDLPPCVRCKGENYSTCDMALAAGTTIQYACRGCDLRVVYSYPPGLLIWAFTPDEAEWARLNAYQAEVRRYRKTAYQSEWDESGRHTWKADPSVPFPLPPPGLIVHRLEGRQWVQLVAATEVAP